MEKEGRTQRACRSGGGGTETDFLLQWGTGSASGTSRRRMGDRRARFGGEFCLRSIVVSSPEEEDEDVMLKNHNMFIASTGKEFGFWMSKNRKSHASLPEKDDQYYMTIDEGFSWWN
ncbi:hypothetical protein QJS10_CPB19g00820 [Acorus calamus]|uniref:Uncharacterized protein n=1 Tax=Acorus calamus TaxID=4465 RepID=A0AAV9CFZ0_ACOCL|nr:hypothetical protein QJS10_CPB19g00820 [Acorus calamus]